MGSSRRAQVHQKSDKSKSVSSGNSDTNYSHAGSSSNGSGGYSHGVYRTSDAASSETYAYGSYGNTIVDHDQRVYVRSEPRAPYSSSDPRRRH